jgi:uncharacterized membrane protein
MGFEPLFALVLPLLGLFALFIVIVPIASLVVAIAMRRNVRSLETRIEALERTMPGAPATERAPAPVAPTPETQPVPPPPPPAPVTPTAPAPPPPPRPSAPAPRPAAAPPPRPAPRPTSRPAATPAGLGQLEGRVGVTWLNRIGALILVLGVGFFLKYAFDNDWVQPPARVALGILAGIVFLALGDRLHRTSPAPAQGVVATGIGILYLSVYAAHGFYHLVAEPAAFGFMVLVTAVGMALAVHHDARAIAILANIGGFLTPIVLSTDRDAAIALFTYLAILDLGMLASAYWRRWPELHLMSFAFTQVLYWGWFARWYHVPTGLGLDAPQRIVALAGATVLFVIFALVTPVEIAGGRLTSNAGTLWHGRAPLILAAPVAYFLAARAVLYPEFATWLGALCLALAAVYVILGQWIATAPSASLPLALFHGALAVGFLTLTFPVQFTGHAVTIAWSVEAAVIAWGAFRLRARPLRVAALLVLALAVIRWLNIAPASGPHTGMFLIDNAVLWPTIFVVLGCGLTAVVYRLNAAQVVEWEQRIYPALVTAATAIAAIMLTVELREHRALELRQLVVDRKRDPLTGPIT